MAAVSTPRLFRTSFLKGKPLNSQASTIVLNVYSKLRQENPDATITKAAARTAELTGVAVRSVLRAKKRTKIGLSSTGPSSPRKRLISDSPQKRKGVTRVQKYDDFFLQSVRRIVHSFFARNEIPTAAKVLGVIQEDKDAPTFGIRTLRRILKDIGIVFTKRKRNSALIDRDDIIVWRRKYLRLIRKFREAGRKIYFTDETWANAGHTKSIVYQDTTIACSRDAFLSGLTTGLKEPSGKGERLVILHAGNEDGFVPNAECVFRAKKGSGDYHEEMDGDHFQKWFISKLLPNIEPNSVIVMDNASYHSVKVEKIPTKSCTKRVIQEWLTSKGITWSCDMLKVELMSLVESVRQNYDQYKIDSIAASAGHTVLRLPPYHCELNPIEMIWSIVKGHVAANNKTFTIKEVEKLVGEGLAGVTQANWEKCVNHVIEKTEVKFWELDALSENIIEPIIINIGDTSSSEESDGGISEVEMLPD